MKLLHIKWGHPRNVEFIVRACRLFNIEYHYTDNSSPSDDKYDIIWAPSNWIDPDHYPDSKIMYGPHFWVFPNPSDPLFTQAKPEHATRCIYLSLSTWVEQLYTEFIQKEQQIIPFVSLPFGVEQKQVYQKTEIEWDCLLYCKFRHPSVYEQCVRIIESMGLKYKIIYYGSYQLDDYIRSLQRAKCVIWIGCHESQGFGLEECLATNTPIFLYDVKSMKEEYVNGRFIYEHYSQNLLATAAPYWSDECGMKVNSIDNFTEKLPIFMNSLLSYQPRIYIERELSDGVCFKRLLGVLQIS